MSSFLSELDDSFKVLSLPQTATEAEIKKAYRKLSLRYHPDKAGKNVDPIQAASRFHEINLAYETLMDPASRARAIQRNADESAKRERQEQYQGKRREMADELERNEQKAIAKRQDAERKARERLTKIAELQNESRRMMKRKQEEIDAEARRKQEAMAEKRRKDEEQASSEREPELQPLDKTVRVRFPASQLVELAGIAPGSLDQPEKPLDTPLANTLADQFGELEHLQFQLPSSNKKLKRELMALATFKSFKDAWQAVVTGGEMRCTGMLEESFIGWAGYTKKQRTHGSDLKDKEYLEPKRVKWYKQNGISQPSDIGRIRPLLKTHMNDMSGADISRQGLGHPQSNTTTSSSSSLPSSSSSSSSSAASVYSKEYEARTLQRLRDAARLSQLAAAQAQPQAAQ
ncbi:related to cell cycle control protein cwf23 [Melanopsichium pennsylvanicum]|uniref:Related to cell cycle control protein cwf23 n=2 Tax=Melanopsichium pennsylvanicum TaxID=63383 RepID=A0AAJ4XME5_9BASI|nr:related to cell cycle control protein cwf23 [Melanopsichium pennsylvanicum]